MVLFSKSIFMNSCSDSLTNIFVIGFHFVYPDGVEAITKSPTNASESKRGPCYVIIKVSVAKQAKVERSGPQAAQQISRSNPTKRSYSS